MKNKKNKKIPKVKNIPVEGKEEAKRFILILVIVLVVVLAVYGVSKTFMKKEKPNNKIVAGKINYGITTVGMMLNRPEKEYYVIFYDKKDTDAMYNGALVNKYLAKEDALKVYYGDTSNKLNAEYIVKKGQKSNPDAKEIKDLKLGKYSLLKIKNGQIVKYLETIKETKIEWGIK